MVLFALANWSRTLRLCLILLEWTAAPAAAATVAELIERALNGAELPDYAGVPDSRAPAGPPVTSPAMS